MSKKDRVIKILARITRNKRVVLLKNKRVSNITQCEINIFAICSHVSDRPFQTYKRLFTDIEFFDYRYAEIKKCNDFDFLVLFLNNIGFKQVSIHKGEVCVRENFNKQWMTTKQAFEYNRNIYLTGLENQCKENIKLINKIKRMKKNG